MKPLDFTMRTCVPSKVARYKGIRKPTCNGGKGCTACWHKYRSNDAFNERARRARWRQ